MSDPLLAPLAKKHGKTPAQILLRWGVQKNFVILYVMLFERSPTGLSCEHLLIRTFLGPKA